MNTHALFEQCKYNILLVEYRGYGKSEGSPSEGGKYSSKYLNNVLKIICVSRVRAYGRSEGSPSQGGKYISKY